MLWLPAIMGIVTFAADRLTKHLVSANMSIRQSIPVIQDIFHITYQTNNGAAFSILSGRVEFLIAATVLIIGALVAYILKMKPKSKLFGIAAALIISGALGNLVDRITRGFVVDFLDARFINFPIFNVADICVVVGAALFCIYVFKSTDFE